MPQELPLADLLALRDHRLEPSDWLTVDQERIDLFAEATGDKQFIHVDPERAAQTPFGSTVAHGFLSLSLIAHLAEERMVVPAGMVMGINYGLNKVRFLTPVKVGSRVRLLLRVLDAVEKKPGQILVRCEAMVAIAGEEVPALIAEALSLFVVAPEQGDA